MKLKFLLLTVIGVFLMIMQKGKSEEDIKIYNETLNDREELLSDAYAFLKAKVLHYAADIYLADHIEENGSTLNDIYKQLKEKYPTIQKEQIERVLRVLQNHRVIIFEEEKYFLTEKGKFLRSDYPGNIRAAIAKENDPQRWMSFGHMHLSVNGGDAFKDTHNGNSFYEYLQKNPQANSRFNEGMSNYSQLEHQLVATSYNFSVYKKIIDVGGGKGELLEKLHKIHPDKRYILIELESVIKELSSPSFQAIAGDFFKPFNQIKADCIILKRVLHNWSDNDCVKILKNSASSLEQNGRLLIIEKTLNTEFKGRNIDDTDIIMLTMNNQAKSRTIKDFKPIFTQAGFKLNQVISVRGCDLKIFEIQKL